MESFDELIEKMEQFDELIQHIAIKALSVPMRPPAPEDIKFCLVDALNQVRFCTTTKKDADMLKRALAGDYGCLKVVPINDAPPQEDD